MALSFYAQLLLILGVATALAWWCGWGLARQTLPRSLSPYHGLLAPLLGYALVVVAGYWGARTVLSIPWVLAIVLPTTGVLNVYAWRRAPRSVEADGRTLLPLLALLLVTVLVGIAPLLRYGHPAIIGGGWDTENYLPTARYLEHGPVAAIASAPPNPLRDINAHPPSIGLTIGFSVWQASVDVLARSEALTSFAPLLAWLRALGVLGIFVLLRVTLGLRPGPALLGTAFTSAGALLLWVTYFNFGMQLAAWPLIPLGLLLSVAAVEEIAMHGPRKWPSVVSAALAVAALPVAYYPALTLWGPLAAGLGVAILLQSRARLRTLLAAGTIALLALVLAAPTVVDYGQGFDYRYGAQLTTLGLFRYVPLTDIMGLTPFDLREEGASSLRATLGLGVLGALMLAGLVAGRERGRWLGVAAGGAAYLIWLRWGQAYPYAYMKGGSYVAFVFLGLAAAGWDAIATRLPARVRIVAVVLPLLLLIGMGISQSRIVADHWEEPGLYAEELPALLQLRDLVPAGSTVTLTSDPRLQGVTTGLAAYLLDHTVVWGRTRTGYSGDDAGEPDAIGEYGLLAAMEDPRPWGYEQPIWRGANYALYQRPEGVRAHLRLQRELEPGATVSIATGDNRLALDGGNVEGGEPRALTFTIASLTGGEMSIGERRFAIPIGQSVIHVGMVDTPQTLEVRNSGEHDLLVQSVTLAAPTRAGEAVEAIPASLYARAHAEATDQTITTRIEAALPGSGPIALALDIWDLPRGVQYGWYGVELGTAASAQGVEMRLDLASGTMEATGPGGEPMPIGARFDGLRPGEYVARLQASAGPVVLGTPTDVFSFEVHGDGTIHAARGGSGLLLAATDRPPVVAEAEIGADIDLLGYALPEGEVHAGDTLDLTLWWQARMAPGDARSVLVHLLDAEGEKVQEADGPPARGARPSEAWQPGEVILDTRQIALAPDLAPGEYTLAIGMYRWPSLERLPVRVDGAPQAEDLYRIPLVIEAEPATVASSP